MPKQSSRFFSNEKCEYFPCHEGVSGGGFNCLFCYCPLFTLPDCGGSYRLGASGRKDCSGCVFPHQPESYQLIVERLCRLPAPK